MKKVILIAVATISMIATSAVAAEQSENSEQSNAYTCSAVSNNGAFGVWSHPNLFVAQRTALRACVANSYGYPCYITDCSLF